MNSTNSWKNRTRIWDSLMTRGNDLAEAILSSRIEDKTADGGTNWHPIYI